MAKIVSFVSFKGGAGRSVALANVAYQLAREHVVGCVDFDIEAGGLHKVFSVGDPGKDAIQHFLMDKVDLEECLQTESPPDYEDADQFRERLVIDVVHDSTSYLADDPAVEGKLYLIQALPDAELTGRVDTGMNMFYHFSKLLNQYQEFCELDYLLIDCRSGISNLGLPGLAYNDLTAIFLRWGTQHRYGTEALLRWYHNWLQDAEMEKPIILVPSSINPETVNQAEIDTFVQDNLSGIPNTYSVIPQIPQLAFEDTVFTAGTDGDLQEPFVKLANRITATLGE